MKKLFGFIKTHEFPFFMAVPAIIWQVVFLYIPLLIMLTASLLYFKDASWFPSFSLAHYYHFFHLMYVKIIFSSLVLALATALLCLLFAYPVAYFLGVKINRGKNIFLFLLMLPFWTSLMVQVYAWFFVLDRHGLINSVLLKIGIISKPLEILYSTAAVYLVMVYCYLPFMIMPLYSSLEKLDKKLLEASSDLGASGWQTFTKITIPLSLRGIKTGFFLVFVPAFGEFVIPTLVGGGKRWYVGTLISHFYLYVRNPFLGAAFTCIVGLFLIVLIIISSYVIKRFMKIF